MLCPLSCRVFTVGITRQVTNSYKRSTNIQTGWQAPPRPTIVENDVSLDCITSFNILGHVAYLLDSFLEG